MALRLMFGKIIRFVGFAWAPVNEELSVVCLILDPIDSCVRCFVFFLFDSRVDGS